MYNSVRFYIEAMKSSGKNCKASENVVDVILLFPKNLHRTLILFFWCKYAKFDNNFLLNLYLLLM